jgi:Protein of unknown function, DUF547
LPHPQTRTGILSRRSFVALIPVAMLVQACSRKTGKADANWLAFGAGSATVDHAELDAFLGKYVRPSADGINRVAYGEAVKAGRTILAPYLGRLQNTAVKDLSRDEQFAFWVNLYNAATVDLILQKYPVASIRDIGLLGQGPWGDKRLKVEGRALSLDDIEHAILRPIWKDVRIHYAVNCASLGCPNLSPTAWRADRLEAMLDAAAAAYINHPRGFAMQDGALIASNIYEWYESDWGSPEKVLDHARKFAAGPSATMLAKAPAIDGYDYNWSLNEAI